MKNRPGIVVLTASLALAQACGVSEQPQPSAAPTVEVDAKAAEAAAREDDSADELFREAGREFDVPPALLKAIAFVQTRYQMVEGAEERGASDFGAPGTAHGGRGWQGGHGRNVLEGLLGLVRRDTALSTKGLRECGSIGISST